MSCLICFFLFEELGDNIGDEFWDKLLFLVVVIRIFWFLNWVILLVVGCCCCDGIICVIGEVEEDDINGSFVLVVKDIVCVEDEKGCIL